MQLALVFFAVFLGILLVFWLLQYVADAMYAVSKWILKKTGNSSLAWNGPLAVVVAAIWAGWSAWIVHLVSTHK